MEELNQFCNNCQRNIAAANFATHSAYCERNIKICKLCNEPFPISEEKEHLEEYHTTVACDYCEVFLEKWLIPKHKELCNKRLIICEFCDAEIVFDEYMDHFGFCSCRTEKCLFCQKYIMLKDKQRHSELHLYEQKILHKNVDSEVGQNIVNEVISNSGASKQNTPEKSIEAENTNHTSDRDVIIKNDTHLESQIINEASTDIPDKSKEMSKRYVVCHICKQSIPWIDMNTHIPTCASDAGKCSRCGETVPSHAMKEHIMKKCEILSVKVDESDLNAGIFNRNGADYIMRRDVTEDHSLKKCQYCKQQYSFDQILGHIKNCSENYFEFECPLCYEKFPERDKIKHESFECRVLLELNESDKLKSYADVARKSSAKETYKVRNVARKSSDKEKHKVSSKPSSIFNDKSPKYEKQNLQSCKTNKKIPCLYCHEEIYVKDEDFHLSVCKEFNASQNCLRKPVYENSYEYKGAMPKHLNFTSMVKPQSAKCKYCKTTLNKNIILYHEEECIHKPVKCSQCDISVPLKDFENHICKSVRGKGNKGKYEKHEKVEEKGGSMFQKFFGKSDKRITDGYENTRNQCKSSSETHRETFVPDMSHYNDSQFSHLDTDDIKIPCEFCGKLCSAFDIVLHETGCNPELACYTKKDSPKDIKENKSLAAQSTHAHGTADVEEFFSDGRKRFLSTARFESLKYHPEKKTEPGEFLKSDFKIKTSGSLSEIAKEYGQNGLIENCSNSSKIHSVWNADSSDTEVQETDLKSIPHTLISDESSKNVNESKISDSIQKSVTDEMSDMLEFIMGDETHVSDKEIYCMKDVEKFKLSSSKSEENVAELACDYSLHPRKHHSEADCHTQKVTYVGKNVEGVEHDIESNQDGLCMQYPLSSGSHFISPHDEDAKEWAKWQSRKSDSS